MKNLMQFITRLLKNKAVLLLLVLVLAVAFTPELANAAPADETSEKVAQSLAKLLSIAMQFLNAMLWPILIVIGDLMRTDLILGPGMESTLKGIWIPVRDLVNIGFVLVLLVVAFYNVLGIGGGEGDLALKTALPKIVLGLVVVNFTFVAGKVVIDLTNVATTAVFALPEMAAGDETPYDFSAVTSEFKINVCYKTYDETGATAPTYWGTADEEAKKVPIYTKLFCTKNTSTGNYDELDGVLAAKYFTDLNANNIGLVMAVNMGGLSNLSLLKDEGIDNFTDLTVSFVFAVVMYSIFAITYIVLGIVLITRLVVLWIALALSPLAVLTYVVPQIKEWTGGGGDFAQKIIKHLMAPIIIGATMSLGYILIAAWDGLAGNSGLANGGFKVDDVISTEFLLNGMNDLPHFIIAIASIVIVWKGVFMAASDTYASFATDAIKGFGESVRDFAFKLPMSIPTVPLGVGPDGAESKISIGGLKMIGDSFMQGVTNDTWNQSQVADLRKRGVTMLGMEIPGFENKNPEANALAFMGAAREGGNVDDARLGTLARSLMNTIAGGSDPTGMASVSRRLEQIDTAVKAGTASQADYDDLRGILNNSSYTPEQLGLKKELREKARKTLNDKATFTKTPAPAPTPTVTPAQTAAVKVAVDLSVEGTELHRQVAPLTASGIPATAATAGEDLKEARKLLAELSSSPSKKKTDEAKAAVDKAIASAAAAKGDTVNVTGPLLASATAAHKELGEIKVKLEDVKF